MKKRYGINTGNISPIESSEPEMVEVQCPWCGYAEAEFNCRKKLGYCGNCLGEFDESVMSKEVEDGS